MKHIETRPAFTLIELLVVTAIIAVLAAILLPTLGRSRYLARRTHEMGQVRQQVTGHLLYADDNNDTLYSWAVQSAPNEFHAPWVVLQNSPLGSLDLRLIARQYGFMASTSNAVVDTPQWDHPGNTAAQLGSPYNYTPGCGIADMATPIMLNRANSGSNMIVDDTERDPAQVPVYYVHSKSGGTGVPGFFPANNPSRKLYLTYDPAKAVGGAVCGYFDGSVRWVDYSALKWGSAGNGWTLAYGGE